MSQQPARFQHVAFPVQGLRDAEDYYAELFAMKVLCREAPLPEAGTWAALPPNRGWNDATAAGVTLGMVALQRDDLILALFEAPAPGQPTYLLGVLMDDEAIDEVAGRLPSDVSLVSHRPGSLEFVDRYGVRWQLSSRSAFRSSGDAFGRWLDVGPTR